PVGIRFWPGNKGRDGARTPMVWERAAPGAGFSIGTPWLPAPDAHRARAADVQAADPASVLAAYRAVLRLRRAHPAVVRASIRFLDAEEDTLAFIREGADEALLCVFNFSDETVDWPIPDGIGPLKPADFAGCGASLKGNAI